MGYMTYNHMVVQMDDRTLVHLQIVIVNKLRRNEAFLMSWKDSPEVGDGRSAVWMHPTMLLQFKFEGSRIPALSDSWLARLAELADSSRGLIVVSDEGGVSALSRAQNRKIRTTVVYPAREPGLVTPPMVHAG